MLNQVRDILQHDCALTRKKPIIVGVSGGADSLTLLNILSMDYPVEVAHFNHLLRPESSKDAQNVKDFAETHGIPYVQGEGDVAAHSQAFKLSIEAAARDLRYQFLFEQAEISDAQAVAVAHNADDQVETALMHLLRGTGLDGLTGMTPRSLPNPWSDTIPLVRPMLGVWRSEIDSYCAEFSLNPIIDTTNNDFTYFRNRLRHELIPELEKYVPGIRTRIWQTTELLGADRNVLNRLTEEIWQDIGGKSGLGYVIFDLYSFNLQSLGMKRRLIRKAISHIRPGARDVDFAMVQRALDFAAHSTASGLADLGLNLRIFLEGEDLIIIDWRTELPKEHWPQIDDQRSGSKYQEALPIPGEIFLGDGWVLKAEIPSDREIAVRDARENSDPYQAWIDLEELEPILNIRSRVPGDRFKPLGMDGNSIKISDFMINQKIPQRARAGWPLVCYGNEIIWVTGYRVGHPYRVTSHTRQVVKLRLFVDKISDH